MAEVTGLVILLAVGAAAVVLLLTAILVREARNPPRRTAAWAIARNLPCDPGDLGLEYESWTLDRPDGAGLPVWEITGRGERGPLSVVMVHGWGRSRVDVLTRLAPWDELAARVVLYDLRGHGEAEGGASRLGHDEGDDLLALLERLGDGPCVLVGHSMGAVIALDAAGAAGSLRSRIAGVVAHGAYDDFHESLRGRLRATGFPTRPFTDLAIAWWRLRGLRHRPTLELAAGVQCPVLLVHGARDAISPIQHAERLAGVVPGAVLHRVDDAAHSDVVERDAPGHDRAVRAFVERLT